jgi:hypothetical protein
MAFLARKYGFIATSVVLAFLRGNGRLLRRSTVFRSASYDFNALIMFTFSYDSLTYGNRRHRAFFPYCCLCCLTNSSSQSSKSFRRTRFIFE